MKEIAMIQLSARGALGRKLAGILSLSVLAVVCGIPASSAQGWQEYKKVGQWTINKYKGSEAAGPNPTCSAVMFSDHIQALRVERIKEGYVFGLNGLSRETVGMEFPVSFWFDGNESQAMDAQGMFAKDEAYPHDDWLSLFHPVDYQPSMADMVGSKNSINFGITDPNNANSRHTITYSLEGAKAAIQHLDGCYTNPPNY